MAAAAAAAAAAATPRIEHEIFVILFISKIIMATKLNSLFEILN